MGLWPDVEPVIGELYDGTACIDGTGRIGEASKLIGRQWNQAR